MSLWTKPIADITYKDVVNFCDNKLPEGTNLDYKTDIPTDLEKIVAALANAFGGLVIIGVTTDSKNRPTKIPGVENKRGFTEQVAQICRDNIFPPVLPEMTQLLPIEGESTQAVAVLRVAQSREAPHATTKLRNRVYTRRNDVTDCTTLADIDHIAHLLERRKELNGKCDSNIDKNLERLDRFIRPEAWPIVWWHVSPLYPWQNICTPEDCFYAELGVGLRRSPNGAIGLGSKTQRPDREDHVQFVSADARGMFFRGEMLYPTRGDRHSLYVGDIFSQTQQFFMLVREFFKKRASAFPGLLSLMIGFRGVAKHEMIGVRGSGGRFPDKEFRAEQIVRYDDFLTAEFSVESLGRTQLMRDMLHAFGFSVA